MIALFIILIIACLVLNIPIAIAIGIATITLVLMEGMIPITLLVQTMFSSSDSFPLIAIPFFILVGEIMSTGGMARRLVSFVQQLVGSFTGSLGIITIIASFIFAAITGSGPATVASIGGMLIPFMIQKGYNPAYAAAISGGSGALGPIIPPSIIFIVYGVIAGVSIGDLFMAGIAPGILVATALLLVNFIVSKKEGYVGVKELKEETGGFWKSLNEAKFALFAPILILGGIYGGVVTPTEASVVGVVYSLIICLFVYKEITFKQIPEIFMKTSITSGAIMIFVSIASFFGKFLSLKQIPQLIADTISDFSTNPIVILLIINLFLLVVGMFMETIASILIFAPLLLPIVTAVGVDPLHFGIIICLNLTKGMLTPPFGINIFIASNIANVPFEKTFKYLFLILSALIIVLLIITFVPEISLFFPQLLN